ncbi:hypothetical protein [Couchioplanes caeruleus]|uniref:Uncharacterized protein n=2 Tax=Couchioplanes caeruleus TaxID=56438 RepID=A0A1K0GNV8_9ACTN|nr:hypothetical protein [Couchioplanes caeruleus]OJF12780.1 hypothetical protein BG844_18810 [Couchioplanes caeruleus subsp. caeruleus]ROP29426.1 hypothetical protein EDD30_2220 [Couchioplanes caeruleus]
MTDNVAPLVRLDSSDAGNAPGLSYNVPDPTSFPGRSYITLDFGSNDPFHAQAVSLDAATPTAVPSFALPSTVRGRMAPQLRPPNGGDGEGPMHDPPEPQAVLRVAEPAQGSTFDSGPDGFDLRVAVQATFTHTSVRPSNATITVNGTDYSAEAAGSPSGSVREYSAAVSVRPGPVSISARLMLADTEFATLAPRSVEVRQLTTPPSPNTTPPSLTVDDPSEAMSLTLSAEGTATLNVAGKAVDAAAGIKSCTVLLDGGSPEDVPVAADGSFSKPLTLTDVGSHKVVVLATNKAGASSQVVRKFSVSAVSSVPRHRLMLVECLRLSNFLGRYGAGRIVQTFSLLPGEKTNITIRTFNTASTTATNTSSVFDSFSETTDDELTSAIANEDTTKTQDEKSLKANVNVKAGATWGWGSASVEAGLAYGTSSAREQLTKNVTNGTSRHAAEKSSKRDIKVDTTKTVTSGTENEQTVVRTLENTSLSRTLNFVFRQMTQEFVSILHLVDVRVGHLTEWFTPAGERVMQVPDSTHPETKNPKVDYEEVALPQLNALLKGICAGDEGVALAEATILRQLDAIFDYRGQWQRIIEDVSRQVPSRDPITGKIRTEPDPHDATKTVPATETLSWRRFDPDLAMTYPEPADGDDSATSGGVPVTVPGVILAVTTNTLRTDGIVVDAFLGGGTALDDYGTRLQGALARLREAEAAQVEQHGARTAHALAVAGSGDAAKAAVWATVFPAPRELQGHHEQEPHPK